MKCHLDQCDKKAAAGGYCLRHYNQKKNGRAFTFGPPRDVGKQTPWLLAHVDHEGDECLKWPFAFHRDGRGQITWEGTTRQTHRVMCELRHGAPPTPKHEAAHSCGKGHEGCVNPNHLRWATRKENVADMVVHGTQIRGEKSRHAILTEQQVRDIREIAEVLPIPLIAAEFGLKPAHVHKVVARTIWRHVA